MQNVLLFLGSCFLIAGFAWYFLYLGKSALTAWIAIVSLLANLFVLKQITLFGFNATASDAFAIGVLLGLNLLQEKYGFEAAKKAIWVSFSGSLFFVVMSQIHLLYIPSAHDQTQPMYSLLLEPAPRLMVASLFTFLLVQFFDTKLYRFARVKFPQQPVLLISAFVMCLSQAIDTIMFTLLGLSGLVNELLDIMLISYGIKVIAIATTVPWSILTRRFLPHQAVPHAR